MSQKYCTQCGSVLEPGSRFCTGCGTMVEQQPVSQAPVYQQAGSWNGVPASNNPYGANPYGYTPAANRAPAEYVSKGQYRRICTNAEYLKSLKTCAIWLYILCGLNAAIQLLTDPVGLVVVVIDLALVLGLHLGKSKGCAIALLCFSIICVVMMLINTGRPGGWWWIIASVGAIRTFAIADREYESVYGIQ